MALAVTIVDGRRQGQSRAEARQFARRGSPAPEPHRAYVDAIYDWPRPTNAAGWADLRRAAGLAAEANCVNRPVWALGGRLAL